MIENKIDFFVFPHEKNSVRKAFNMVAYDL